MVTVLETKLNLLIYYYVITVTVIDKFDYVFSENGLVAKKKGREIERTVSKFKWFIVL